MALNDIEALLDRSLPYSYKQLVKSIEDFAYFDFNEFPNEHPDDEGSSWFFWDEKRLCESVQVDGIKNCAAWQQLVLHIEIDKQTRQRNFAPSPGGPVAHERLKKTICFAEDNADLLYIDPTDENSIWIYMHDSGEVKRIAVSFDEWIGRARRCE